MGTFTAGLVASAAWIVGLSIGCASPAGHATVERGDASTAIPTSPKPTPVAAIDASARAFTTSAAGVFDTAHPSQRWSATIDARGGHIAQIDGAWSLGLHVDRVGRAAAMRDVEGAPATARGGRVEIDLGDGAREWFAHPTSGLEHGIDLAKRAPGVATSDVVLRVAVDGLAPAVARKGRHVTLHDARGNEALRYTALSAVDADRRALPASMSVESGAIVLHVSDAGARYPISIDPLVIGQQQAELVALDGAANDHFGLSVAISGDAAIVGSPNHTSVVGGSEPYAGAAYAFARSGTTWTQQGAAIVASDGSGGASFGSAVALSGATAIVGAPQQQVGSNGNQGAAYVFVDGSSGWTQLGAALHASDGAANALFGSSVAVDGSTAIIAANGGGVGGNSAYIFVEGGSAWTQLGPKLLAAGVTGADEFGCSVAISGTTALVGAARYGVGGAVFVFAPSGASWVQQGSPLTPSDATTGAAFGSTVAISGTTAIVSAPGAYEAYVFTQSSGVWTQQGAPLQDYRFNAAVAIGGANALVAGVAGTPSATVGVVYEFAQTGAVWTQEGAGFSASPTTTNDSFGHAIAVSGATAIVGADLTEVASHGGQGAAYAFVAAHSDGDGCTLASDCDSGFCVDGICCSAACSGACNSCVGARTGGSDGTCAVVKAVSSCAACASDADCAPVGAYCASTVCTAKAAIGAPCAVADQCTSGFCADGVCCATACTASKCQACAEMMTGSANGTCANVSPGQDPHGDCPGTKCSDATLTVDACNGAGSCSSTPIPCAPFACNAAGNACSKSCTVDSDCATTGYCNAGICAAKSSNGVECSANDACSSGFCVDGHCCNSTCTGQCQACDVAGSVGTCEPVTLNPHGARPSCSGAGTACEGTCDGIDQAACSYPSVGTSCGTGCTSGSHQVCDNKGVCLPASSCPGNLQCANATSCSSTCTTNSDCVSGFTCSSGVCVSEPTATCSADGSQSIPAGGTGSPQACAPYKCIANGGCGTSCSQSSDCASGTVCDTAQAPGTCVAAATSDGGGCSVGAASSVDTARARDFATLLLAMAVAGVARRRARSTRC